MNALLIKPTCLGLVNLALKDGSLYKKSLICRTGYWDGRVEVTESKLRIIADKYNKQRAKPINANDFAPILVDHNRMADAIKGRLMADLTVEPFEDPETAQPGFGLYGTLRIDDADAQLKVDSGKYAQVSMSFDDDATFEIYETSFVAVEAARRSQLLNQGETTMNVELAQKLATLETSHAALLAAGKLGRSDRRAVCLAMATTLATTQTEVSAFGTKITETILSIKAAVLTAQLKGFIREGKLTKAEFDKLDAKKLAGESDTSLGAILASYQGRTPSVHAIPQHGKTGAEPVDTAKLSTEDLRTAITAQLSGKKGTALAADENDPKGKKDGDTDGPEMGLSDVQDALSKLGEIMPAVTKACDYMKKMSESLQGMQDKDKEEDPAA